MDDLEAVRRAILEGRYSLTRHAVEEAAADGLHRVDIESAVLTGGIVLREIDPARGPKLVIEGKAADLSTRVGVVVRLQSRGDALIITVFEAGEN